MKRALWWTGAVVVAALTLSLSSSCTLRSAQKATVALDADVDDGLGGTGIESGDVRGAADQIARALAHDLKSDLKASSSSSSSARVRVAVLPVQNRTRFRIDPALVQNHLVHDLMQQSRRRFQLVAVRDHARATATTTTATAVLRTELRGLTKDDGATTSDYVEYWFALEDAVDGTLLWSGMYETKRASSVDVIYQ
ncbi:MAG: hypothetical protein Q8O67_06965 [Deltaproteobacteria bacterium]|nr:hypothetical protein [Deltaproteobacteria bacterium]